MPHFVKIGDGFLNLDNVTHITTEKHPQLGREMYRVHVSGGGGFHLGLEHEEALTRLLIQDESRIAPFEPPADE